MAMERKGLSVTICLCIVCLIYYIRQHLLTNCCLFDQVTLVKERLDVFFSRLNEGEKRDKAFCSSKHNDKSDH